MTTSSDISTKHTSITSFHWDLLPSDSAIRNLAIELKSQVAREFDSNRWKQTGHALLIEHVDCEEVEKLLPALAAAAGFAYRHVPRIAIVNDVRDWLPETITKTPTIFFLEPGAWVGNHDSAIDYKIDFVGGSEGTAEEFWSFRATLAEHIQRTLPSYPVVLITTVPDLHNLDISLRRVGIFDRRFKLPTLSPTDTAQRFIGNVGSHICDTSITNQMERVGIFLQDHYVDSRRRDLAALALQRLAWRKQRKVNFSDFLQSVIYGTSEQDALAQSLSQRNRHAVHEAGHALMAIVNSDGLRVPEFCSVQTLDDSHGVVVPSAAHVLAMDDPTVFDVVHGVRVSLAGRAAEVLVWGAQGASTSGCAGDLKNATALAYKLFGKWGCSPAMDSAFAGCNLAVVIENPVAAKPPNLDETVRSFLEDQFNVVLSQLTSKRDFLDRIVEALLERPILVRDDLERIMAGNDWRMAA